MRTTVIIPDVVVEGFDRLKQEELVLEMKVGYEAEAREPSLESGWDKVEMEGLP